MKLQHSGFFKLLGLLIGFSAIVSCKKTFDVLPKSAVDQTQAYRNVNDADAAVIGIYGKFLKLAKQYELWNELRADLMDITNNSDIYLKQLSEHTVTADNPYINPQPFYDVILNCNDALYNFNLMLAQNKFKRDEYNQRYSDVGALRSWVYLQLAIHFGNIPYVTDPLIQVADLHDVSKFPMYPLKQVIDSLTSFTEKLPFLDDYPAGTNLQTTVDAYPTNKFFINKRCLLGDLYLWEGLYDKAATQFNLVMNIQGNVVPAGAGEAFYTQYRISNQQSAGINYTRAQDFSTLNYTNGWRDLFERPATDLKFFYEWIWALPFDPKFQPIDPFIDIFSPIGGSYLVRPSQQAMDNWNSQIQVLTVAGGGGTPPPAFTPPTPNTYIDNFPFDSRGFPFTYKFIGGQPVIMKFLYNYLDGTSASSANLPLNSLIAEQGRWFLERAATLHLHYSEAANRAGHPFLAYALTNYGITYHYDPYHSNASNRDARNIEQTFLPDPYNFDGRLDAAPFTNFRQIWYRNNGIRGRAGVKQVPLPATSTIDSIPNVENMIIDEEALELAYEGNRWQDLLRIAIRRNDPSFIANKVYNKLSKSNLSSGAASAARSKLMSKDWFFPFKFQ